MRGHRLLLILGVGALLLTPSAGGGPAVPGDPTPPVVTPHIFGTLGSNGWYVSNVTVNWTVEDPESVILETRGCDAVTLTNDTAGTPLTCFARSDGGETTVTVTIRRDATGPVVTATPARAPDSNGWYNHSLAVSFSGTDATSGMDSCVGPQTYPGPDGANVSVSGTCRDRAGNTTARVFSLSYDATLPQVSGATPSRGTDHNGWYNHTLTIAFAGADATSGIDTCTQASYSGPDSGNASVSGTCRDRAGNTSAAGNYGFAYDETGPAVTATPARGADSNGWYNHALSVSFSGSDATSGLESCVGPQTYSGPDGANVSVSGSCSDRAGNTTVRAFGLSYDSMAPQVTGSSASRNPDSNGWYNHAFTITFAGTDATSGIDSCTQTTYSGPDDATGAVDGTCRDRAGNTSAAGTFHFMYDATGPVVTATPGRVPDSNGWYNHALSVTFSGTDATSGMDSCVGPQTYSGPDGSNVSISGSCRDRAGNTTVRAFGLNYDSTGPAVTATPARPPDSNSWYNRSLSVSFSGTDATSGMDSCVTPQTYSGPDGANVSVSGSCRDRAGNTTVRSFGLSYDAAGPMVTATPARAPDSNGWYNHSLAVSFSGTDATSGVESCIAPQTYSGPDDANASVNGSCRDRAGNTTVRAFGLSYDAAGPVVTATPARAPDSNSWYNHALAVSFSGTDATSAIDSCVGPQTYSGPDGTSVSVSGSCRDRAGNTTARSFGLNYDATAPQVTGASPSRGPDHNGWYNHTLTVAFAGSDATSGIESCTQASYSGPDAGNASVSGTCRDRAGNTSAPGSFGFMYDGTGPVVTATPARAPDSNGWYNHALAVSFSGTDATSGLDSCGGPQTYSGPDGANVSVSGSCVDHAGNTSVHAFGLSYDATAPQATASPARDPDANGWYARSLLVTFKGTDATAGIDACTEATYSGPDDGNALLSGSCTDRAGNRSPLAFFAFGYDATPPAVVIVPARPPDANGWYNHPLAAAVSGIDATSGVETCSQATYSGPDSADASLTGFCRDRAGNEGSASVTLEYDATAPAVGLLVVKPGKGSAELHWRGSAGTQSVELARAPGLKGAAESIVYSGPGSATSYMDKGLRAGRLYHYRLTLVDQAANQASKLTEFMGRGALLYPAPGERVNKPPLLVWTPVRGATYYNVVLVRGRRVFSAWPVRTSLQIPRAWRYHGHRYRLRPGLYRWYVWPGLGRLAAGRYGKLLGASSFVVSR